MTIATAKNTPRNTYTASGGQTVFAIGFEFFATGDIKVFRNGTALTYNAAPSSVAQFSVQGTTNASDSAYEFGAGGTVTLGAGATADDSIVIVRDIVVERTTDFTPAASFDVTALNTQLDVLMAMMAEREESSSRSIRLPLAETTTGFDMQLPVKASRANKILEFDGDGDPACTITSTNLSALGAITTDITAVAGVASNVTTVAGIASNVTTVAGKASEITSVAAKASLITSDFVSDLNTLATSAIVTDLDILANADIVADLAILATSDVVSDLNTLATSDIVTDINVLATSDIVSDLNTLATSDIVSDLNTLATSAIVADLAILATSDIVSDINVLATSDIVSDLNTLATSDFVSDLNIVGTTANVANIATVASNVAGVNSFAARYRVAGSDPGSDNDAGDLVFNTSSNILKVYNGSSFDDVTGSTLAGLSDTNITSPADGSLLLYDTGTSKYIDNVISGDATLADTGVLTLTANSVDSDQYVDGSIDTIHIADGQITSAKLTGAIVTPSTLDMNGQEFILDADADTSITADTDDRIDFKVGGTDRAYLTTNHVGAIINRQNANPLIINGDMTVNQRGDVTAGTTTGFFALDRWRFDLRGGFNINVSQSTDVPSGYGFGNSIKLDCNVEDTSPDANGLLLFQQIFEGQDLQLLNYGTSSAQKLTIAFWVKCTKTGTFQVNLRDEDSRHIGQLVTINSANTWEKKIIALDGDTAGAIANSNASSIRLQIFLDAGSDSSGGGVPSTWQSVSPATKSFNGNLAFGQANANEIFFTGIQVEVGEYDATTIPPFQHESFGDSLLRCERYYKQFGGNSSHERICLVFMASTSQARGQIPISMRAAPSIEANNLQIEGTAAVTVNSVAVDQPSPRVAAINFNCDTGIAAGQGAQAQGANNTSARLKLSAEL